MFCITRREVGPSMGRVYFGLNSPFDSNPTTGVNGLSVPDRAAGSTHCHPIPHPIDSTDGAGLGELGRTGSSVFMWAGRLLVSCQD